MSNKSLSQKLQLLLDDAISAGSAPGLVAVIFNRTDASLGSAAAGVRNTETKEPMTLDTVCWMASMSKSIASMAALKLVEELGFDLDSNDALAAILPELKLGNGHPTDKIFDGKDTEGNHKFRPAKIGITLRHLLLHTAGFEYFFNSEEMESLVGYLDVAHSTRLLIIPCLKYTPVGTIPGIMEGFTASFDVPRVFEAGTKWSYGTGKRLFQYCVCIY